MYNNEYNDLLIIVNVADELVTYLIQVQLVFPIECNYLHRNLDKST